MVQNRVMVTRWGRWTATFIGFPLAGVAARLVAGGIDSPTAAVAGGLVGGAVLGAVQVGIGGIDRADWVRWIGATAAGLAWGSDPPSSTTVPTPRAWSLWAGRR